ncbi:MAG TPA: UbiA family prenyltransferase [Longimicrobiales bacterium]|nr:UbiA family prenyltransferase [Longimicrobiales bacterium]
MHIPDLNVSRPPAAVARGTATWQGHLQIARVDHWVKNVFVLPGVVAAYGLDPTVDLRNWPFRLAVALLAVGLVASSNYTINEVLDAPYDRHHPTKHRRAVPSGRVSVPLAYVQWLVLFLLGLTLSWTISPAFTGSMVALWVMGCVYNVPPVRSKDVPYLDVLTEAINNPIRLAAGWYILAPVSSPPASLLIAYWMVGCYFMGIKRFAEYRHIGEAGRIAAYRRSLAAMSEAALITAIVFYASVAMLFFGAFLMRYRLELVLSFPLIALVMAMYLHLGFDAHSAAQSPEKLFRAKKLMGSVFLCAAAMLILFFVDVPIVHEAVTPRIPEAVQVPPDSP